MATLRRARWAIAAILVSMAYLSNAQAQTGLSAPAPIIGAFPGAVQIANPCEALGRPPVVTIISNAPNAREFRVGNTHAEMLQTGWRAFSPTTLWYARAQDRAAEPRVLHIQFRDRSKRLASALAVAPDARLSQCWRPFDHRFYAPADANEQIRFSFDDWHQEWVSYDFQSVPVGNLFYPLSWAPRGGVNGSAYVWTDDSRWSIDTPETPHSILFALIYPRWLNRRATDAFDRLDLRDAIVEFSLRGRGLDLKGARIQFWVTTASGRHHYVKSQIDIHEQSWTANQLILGDGSDGWIASWLRDGEEPMLNLADIDSMGFAFVGFPHDTEVTGAIAIDEFVIRRADSREPESAGERPHVAAVDERAH